MHKICCSVFYKSLNINVSPLKGASRKAPLMIFHMNLSYQEEYKAAQTKISALCK